METNVTPAEYALRVVNSYAQGIICRGEVWSQFIDHAKSDTSADFMAQLTPELAIYFRQLATARDFGACRSEQEALALRLLMSWYETHAA